MIYIRSRLNCECSKVNVLFFLNRPHKLKVQRMENFININLARLAINRICYLFGDSDYFLFSGSSYDR